MLTTGLSKWLNLGSGIIVAIVFGVGCAAPASALAVPRSLTPPLATPTLEPPSGPSSPGPTALPLPPTPDVQAQLAGVRVDISAHPAAATVGELITLIGRPVNLGLPQYTLYLRGEPAVTIRYDGQLIFQGFTGPVVEFVSASASQSEVEFRLRAAQPGVVEAMMSVSGEVRLDMGQEQTTGFAWSSATSPGVTLTVVAARPAGAVFEPGPLSYLQAGPAEVTLPLLAWTVALDDGSIYVLDSTTTLYRLAPITLSLVARSLPLFSPLAQLDPADSGLYLLAGGDDLFVGNRALAQTLVLRRNDFSVATRLNQAGPMALEPGRRLFLIPQQRDTTGSSYDDGVWTYDLANLHQPPRNVIPARRQGSYLEKFLLQSLAIDPVARQIYVSTWSYAGGGDYFGKYERYQLDTFEHLGDFGDQNSAKLGPDSVAAQAGLIVVVNNSQRGPLSSSLLVVNVRGEIVNRITPFAGHPIIDPAGDWIYLLRPSGLWALDAHDLALQTALPFLDTPAYDLALSPDGQTLYLFGHGWLAGFNAADLRAGRIQALPFTPPGSGPAALLCTECGNLLSEHRPAFFYPSPDMEQDRTAFVQFDYGETYHTTDSGHSWSFLAGLFYPDFKYSTALSLSPDFARDQTLVAYTASYSLYRSLDGGVTWADWSPPIAFTSDRDGNREIYLMNQQGGDLRRLTNQPADDENPAWSPAWTRLAFQSQRSGNWDIFSLRVDCDPTRPGAETKCDLHQLTTDPADDLLPAWSPDGRSIAFVSTRDGNPEIYLMDADGQNQRRLTFHPNGDWRPAWFGDSQRLAFTGNRSGSNDIYQLTVPAAITMTGMVEPKLTPLVTDPADDRDPAVFSWGADQLLFLSNRAGITQAYILDDYVTTVEAQTPNSQAVAHPAWVETGYRQILVTLEQNGQTDIYAGSKYDGYIPLTHSSGFDGQPAWGPPHWIPTAATNRAWLNRLIQTFRPTE